MLLTCKPLAQGQILPEMLKAIVLGDNKRMCLITCGQQICRQEICQDVCLPLIGSRQKVLRQEVCQDICLPLTRPDGNIVALWDCLFKPLQGMTHGHFLEAQR